jgi:hypothetical protein
VEDRTSQEIILSQPSLARRSTSKLRPAANVLRGPDLNAADVAYNRFLYDYVVEQDLPNMRRGHLEALPGLRAQCAIDSPLAAAILAASFANFRRRCNALHVEALATRHYVTAIKRIRPALEDPLEAQKDATLLASHLLSLYEVNIRERA